MSTKIYCGFRFQDKDLRTFQEECNTHLMKRYRQRFNALVENTGKLFEAVDLFNAKENGVKYIFFFSGELVHGYYTGPYSYMYKPDWVEDFSYWNNSDQPEDVPEGEWRLRGKFWDSALDYENKCFSLEWEVMGEFAPNFYILYNEIVAEKRRK